MARRLALLTTGRQDYGVMRSLILALRSDDRFSLDLWVGGMHLSDHFGRTESLLREDGIDGYREFHFLADPPDPARDAARAMARAVDMFEEDRPEAVILLGDRTETMAVATAAAMLSIPVVHLHGGEESVGAVDNALRHAITKLSHLHFTTHETHRERVLQMGEPEDSVYVVAPPGTDNLHRSDLPDREELLESLGLSHVRDLDLVVATVHPTTLSQGEVLDEVRAVAYALERVEAAGVITMPNSDAGGLRIRRFWERWAEGRDRIALSSALGERRYWGLIRSADAMVGNSSSGLIEAPAAFLPVVNVGDRQKGRMRHPMTLDVPPDGTEVLVALRRALEPDFREELRSAPPLYASGPVAAHIVSILAEWTPPSPPRKAFVHREGK